MQPQAGVLALSVWVPPPPPPARVRQRCDVTNHRTVLVSLCPQALPFFSVKFGLGIPEATHKLCGFLKSLGEPVCVCCVCCVSACLCLMREN